MLVQGLKTVINTRLHIRCIVVLEKIALGCGCVPVYQCPACLAHLWCSVSLLNKKLSLSLSLSFYKVESALRGLDDDLASSRSYSGQSTGNTVVRLHLDLDLLGYIT